MINKKIIVTALILTMCTSAMLTSCGSNNNGQNAQENGTVSGNAAENKGPVDNVIDGVQNGVDNIENGLMNGAEEATHAYEEDTRESARNDGHNASDKGDMGMNSPSENAKSRRTAPIGK